MGNELDWEQQQKKWLVANLPLRQKSCLFLSDPIEFYFFYSRPIEFLFIESSSTVLE
jgi:hypothetical protein